LQLRPATETQRTQPEYQTQQQEHRSADATMMQKIRVVDKEVIDNDLTANSVIGEDVYGTDGEKIGEVHDLKFEGAKIAQLRQQYLRAKTNGGDDIRSRAADSVERTGDRVADNVERAGERTADAIDRNDSPEQRDSDADRAADRLDRASDRAADRLDRATDEVERDQEWATDRGRDAWETTDRMSEGGGSIVCGHSDRRCARHWRRLFHGAV
jgi:ElaB/YqjD/DUF883 family membrane-anchored ribosome-binding protein